MVWWLTWPGPQPGLAAAALISDSTPQLNTGGPSCCRLPAAAAVVLTPRMAYSVFCQESDSHCEQVSENMVSDDHYLSLEGVSWCAVLKISD